MFCKSRNFNPGKSLINFFNPCFLSRTMNEWTLLFAALIHTTKNSFMFVFFPFHTLLLLNQYGHQSTDSWNYLLNMYEIINHCIFSEIDPYSSTCFRIVIYTIYTYIIYLQIFIYIILLCIVYNIRSQTKLLQSATHCCFIRNEMIIILQQKWNRFYLLSLSR